MAAGRKTKLICGTEWEIVVAHGRLPSPAHRQRNFDFFFIQTLQQSMKIDSDNLGRCQNLTGSIT